MKTLSRRRPHPQQALLLGRSQLQAADHPDQRVIRMDVKWRCMTTSIRGS